MAVNLFEFGEQTTVRHEFMFTSTSRQQYVLSIVTIEEKMWDRP